MSIFISWNKWLNRSHELAQSHLVEDIESVWRTLPEDVKLIGNHVLNASSPLHIFLGTDFQWQWVLSWCRTHLHPETQQDIYVCRLSDRVQSWTISQCKKAPKVKGHVGVNLCVIRVTHLLGVDVVGHIHHMVVMVTEAFYFGHHRGLDAGLGHLISFLVDEDPAAGQRTRRKRFHSRWRGQLKNRRIWRVTISLYVKFSLEICFCKKEEKSFLFQCMFVISEISVSQQTKQAKSLSDHYWCSTPTRVIVSLVV